MRTLIPPEPIRISTRKGKGPGASNSPQNEEDLVPYSAKDLKYLWTMWDEAHRHHSHRPALSEHLCRGLGHHPGRLAQL